VILGEKTETTEHKDIISPPENQPPPVEISPALLFKKE
jgi:hypothetical protein